MIKDDRLHGQTCTLSNIGAVGGSQAYTAIIDYPIPWGLAQFQQVGESFSSNLVQYNYIYILYRGEMVKHRWAFHGRKINRLEKRKRC